MASHPRIAMIKLLLCLFLISATAYASGTLIVVTGAAGETEFGESFARQSTAWKEAGTSGGLRLVEIGSGPEKKEVTDFETLRAAVTAEKANGMHALWIVLNGHGTWDGKNARFNLRGPDVSADDLSAWLKPMKRPCIIINTSSASAPFITSLAAPGRIVITATRSGNELNFARFGKFLASSLVDRTADIDTDGSISLLEAYLAAARKTIEFYRVEKRLATEHALLDDNGDGQGTPVDWFRGLRAIKKSDKGMAVDGEMARRTFLIPPASDAVWTEEMTKQRDLLESRLQALREAKSTMREDDYYNKLEPILLELAMLTRKATEPRK